MRCWLVDATAVALTLSACTVPEFAGPGGHDEDNDGIADELDLCPHIAGARGDSDGDGVGDACDPAPNDGGDMKFFYAFDKLPPELEVFGGLQQYDSESLELDGIADEAMMWIPATFSRVQLEIGFHVLARDEQSSFTEITLRTMHDPSAPLGNTDSDTCYYGQVLGGTGSYLEARELHDNATDATVPLQGTIDGVKGHLAVIQTSDGYACRLDGGPGPAVVSPTTMPLLVMGQVGITANNLEVQLDYLFAAGR